MKKEKESAYRNKQDLILENRYQLPGDIKQYESGGGYNIAQKSYQKSYAGSDTKKTGSSTYNINERIGTYKYGMQQKELILIFQMNGTIESQIVEYLQIKIRNTIFIKKVLKK